MSFWVYENWQAGPHKAVIHDGRCGFCKDGQGLRPEEHNPRHAAWHGPYPTIEDARGVSRTLPGVVVHQEHVCVAHLG